MEIIYRIGILGIILLGIAHSFYTFKKYKKIEADSLWFFSAAPGLIFCGLINYMNLIIRNQLTLSITLVTNVILTLFAIVLAFTLQKVTTFTLLLFALLLLIISLILI